jgi:tetratricopeptide (TPR) repeat protein
VYDIRFDHLKKRCVFSFLLALLFLTSFSQNKVDSITHLVQKTNGAEKHDALVALVREYGKYDNIKALETAEHARDLAYSIGDSTRIVLSQRLVGQLLNRLDKGKEAIAVLMAALPIAKRNNLRDDYKVILNNLAAAYVIQAEYDKALEINFQTLVLREEDKDIRQISISLNNIGLVYFKLSNFEKALDFYQRAFELKKQVRDDYDLDRLMINIGLCYIHLGDYRKANVFFNDAFKTCGDNCTDQIKVEGEFGIGVAEYAVSNFSESAKHLNESYSIAKKIGAMRFQSENLIYIARIHEHHKDTTSAVKALKLCETISAKLGYNQLLLETYGEYSHLHKS